MGKKFTTLNSTYFIVAIRLKSSTIPGGRN